MISFLFLIKSRCFLSAPCISHYIGNNITLPYMLIINSSRISQQIDDSRNISNYDSKYQNTNMNTCKRYLFQKFPVQNLYICFLSSYKTIKDSKSASHKPLVFNKCSPQVQGWSQMHEIINSKERLSVQLEHGYKILHLTRRI